MKLTIPPLEIEDNEGFTNTEKDIFERQPFGERLANLIEKSDGNLVLALEAPWGEGKSTFIKMWKGHIQHHRESKMKAIYFDAFANDYQKDAFFALASEIFELLKDEGEEKKKEFMKEASKVAKALTRGALKIGVRSISGGILDGSIVDGAGKELSELIATQVDSVIEERLENTTKDKLALLEFRKYLEGLASSEEVGCPIVFIVDELDRCRPDFALELIEQIKHLFSVSGITFLLVMNREQLEASVNKRYGQDIKSSLYLQKFVNLWLTLPRKIRDVDHSSQYIEYAFKAMQESDEIIRNNIALETIKDLVVLNQSSYREIEQILSSFALLHNMAGETRYVVQYQLIMAFVCFIKSAKNKLIELINKDAIDFERLLKESGLFRPAADHEHNLKQLRLFIKYDLGDDNVRKEMLEKSLIKPSDCARHTSKNVIRTICQWLADIQTNN